MVKAFPRAFSLLEVMVSLVLFACVVWSLQTLYVGLMLATRKAGTNQEVTAALQTVVEAVRDQNKKAYPWPAGGGTTTSSGSFLNYTYGVTDYGMVPNPKTPGKFLDLKLMRVDLYFYQTDTNTLQSQWVTFSVAH
jgi:prepilin-type N-terminal cleavage/methylation domain-containing protein